MNEAETRAKLIDPALHRRGWTEDLIKREVTAGEVEIVGGRPRRRRQGRADYTLRVRVSHDTQPVAVALIEAKKDDLPPTHGMEQGKQYAEARRLNVPFVFSTNGHLFVAYDRTTGLTSKPQPMAAFPTPTELRARYEASVGFNLEDEEARPLLMPYPGGEAGRRYYQDAAIRAVLEKIAAAGKQGRPRRALLTMATGSGKTRVAVNLLKRFYDAGQLRRALFVVDRDELRTQALGALQAVFGSDARVISANNPEKNARIVVATYQTLGIATDEETATFLRENYPPDYFSHIIIDECHRSAWGKWSEVLMRNAGAVQVGLTATPRELRTSEETFETRADAQITADNLKYFGEPVYEYDLGQAIADGYLAACEIRKGQVNLDDTGVTIEDIMARNPVDAITGRLLTVAEVQALYLAPDFESKLLLPDRVQAMCADLFDHLLQTGGPEQKTVVFCVRDLHADLVATELNNRYVAWCDDNGVAPCEHFAFKCTQAGGKDYLADLRGSSRDYFIATTVELLSTGVDVPCLRNVVFFRYLKSPILLHQMIGRGTRLDPATEKLMFRVYDYTDATRLYGEDFITEPPRPDGEDGEHPDRDGRERAPVVQVEGFDVRTTDAGRLILTHIDGETRPVTVEEYRAHLAARLLREAPTLDALRERWVDPEARQALLQRLPEEGQSARLIQRLEEMDDYDLYDVLGELGYGMTPHTCMERAGAFAYKNADWLTTLPKPAAETLRALTRQFASSGIEALESPHVFKAPDVVKAGGLPALRVLGNTAEVLREAKVRLLAA